ncbi:MAG: polysaccharide biosynthesis tyrosine autokinase [Armatimonadetes bacterium]|nr:polysaccharide biosynthesis tyrosine autokinase [Armatimonadota bacterium]
MQRLEARPTEHTGVPADAAGLDIRRYLRLLDHRKWWLVGCITVAMVSAVAYNATQTPVYEGRATLLVETGGRSSQGAERDVLMQLTGMGRARTLGTQIEIVKSPTRIKSAARIVAARQIVVAALIPTEPAGSSQTKATGAGGLPPPWLPQEAADALRGDVLPALGDLQRAAGLSRVDLEKLVVNWGLNGSEGDSARYPPGIEEVRGPAEAAVPSGARQRLLEAIRRSLPAIADECRRLLVQCTVAGVRDTDVIGVTCRSTVPDLAASYADAICQEYEWRNLLSNRESAKKGAAWVEEQAGKARAELDEQGQALRNLLKESGLASVPEAATTLTARVSSLTDAVSTAQAAVRADEAGVATLRKQLTAQQQAVVASTTTQSTTTAADLRSRLVAAQEQRASLLEKVTEKHPGVSELDARINELERQLADELGRTVQGETRVTNPLGQELLSQVTQSQVKLISDQAHLAAMEGTLARAQGELARIPDVEQKLAQRQREMEIAEKSYLALLDTLQSLNLAQATEAAGASVLDHATVQRQPVAPNKRLNLIMALLLGVIGGLALAVVVDHLDNTIKDPEELERDYGLSILGVIPKVRSPHSATIDASDGEAASAEPYRTLRSNLRFAATDGPVTCVLVTSPGPGEGKTTTAINLAATCGEMGEGVVLADTDLRRPAIAANLGLPNETGVTSCVVGEQPIAAVLQETRYPGMRTITSGPTPPNALQILESAQMTAMVAELRKLASLVVFDSPPAVLFADAQALASLVDGVVLVIEIGVTRRPVLVRALEALNRTGTRCLGVVINKAVAGRGGYGYYYYGYYYRRYGYYHDYYDSSKPKSEV